jgi:hypothetical protein
VGRATEANKPAGGGCADSSRPRTGWTSGLFLWVTGVLAALSLATVLGLVVGFDWGERSAHTRHLIRQRGRVVEILRRGQQPLVTFRQTSGIALKGTVSHQAALDQLRDDLIIEFGQDAVNAMLADVRVEAPGLPDESQ